MAVLSMVAITRPEAFGAPHVALVLRYGFSHRCRDALLTRQKKLDDFVELDFTPFDPVSKRTESLVQCRNL